MAATREQIVEIGRSWLGTAFRHCGRSRREIDCFGHLVLVSRESGYPVRDSPKMPYSTFVTDQYQRYLTKHAMDPVPIDEAQAGDWYLLGDPKRDFGTHTAMLTGAGTLVHACTVALRVVEVPIDDAVMGKVKMALRFRGLA